VHRYGSDIVGGAEQYCRKLAARLGDQYGVEIFTTCAKDYLSWENEYPEGITGEEGIPVRRFKSTKKRNIAEFEKSTDRILNTEHTFREELDWIIAQGPQCPDLIWEIAKKRQKFDLFFFFTYLYYPTYFGLPLVREKALLIPTVHNEPTAYLDAMNPLFRLPRAIAYNTEEEKLFVNRVTDNAFIRDDVIGIGVDAPETAEPPPRSLTGGDPYLLYVGRIDTAKGCEDLFSNFIQFKKRDARPLKLLLVGDKLMEIPSHPDIRLLGYVEEDTKFSLLAGAAALILPSLYESLSIVTLESWAMGTPVIVRKKSEVMCGQVERSEGGLQYEGFEEFAACVDRLLQEEKRRILGSNGKKYIKNRYTWPIIMEKFQKIINVLLEETAIRT